jgi:hypothetical protein
VNLFFTTVGSTAWNAGGLGPLAGFLAIVLVGGAGLVLFEDSVPVRIPVVALLAGAVLLGLIALLVVGSGSAGAGAFVTLLSTAVMGYAANALRTREVSTRRPVGGRRPPSSGAVKDSSATSRPRFCPGCGAAQDESASFCASLWRTAAVKHL